MSDTLISEARTPSDFAEARRLFEEYAAALGVDLCFQNFAQELEALSETYGAPHGCVLIARRNGAALGCVAFRAFMEEACEMKRLYVQPRARGAKLGRELTTRLIQSARAAGYRRVVLHTLESMAAARALYLSLGFRERSAYDENPIPGAIYMELDLAEQEAAS